MGRRPIIVKRLLVLVVVWCLPRAAAPAVADGMQLILQNPTNAAPRLTSLWGGAGSEQFVLKSDGTAWVWGWNSFGQQGDGTTNNTCVPHQVLGPGGIGLLTNLSAIMGGETHTSAPAPGCSSGRCDPLPASPIAWRA